jgi:hypothetical protein
VSAIRSNFCLQTSVGSGTVSPCRAVGLALMAGSSSKHSKDPKSLRVIHCCSGRCGFLSLGAQSSLRLQQLRLTMDHANLLWVRMRAIAPRVLPLKRRTWWAPQSLIVLRMHLLRWRPGFGPSHRGSRPHILISLAAFWVLGVVWGDSVARAAV